MLRESSTFAEITSPPLDTTPAVRRPRPPHIAAMRSSPSTNVRISPPHIVDSDETQLLSPAGSSVPSSPPSDYSMPPSPVAVNPPAAAITREFKCGNCDTIFTNIMDLRRHRINCHPDNVPNSCKLCVNYIIENDECEIMPTKTALRGTYRSFTIELNTTCITSDQFLLSTSSGMRRILSLSAAC